MILHLCRKAALVAIALFTLSGFAHGQTVTSLNDLNYWGSGSNHSALVIAWNDGKASGTIAWGFSWNGTATVADMLTALANDDPRLFARIDSATQYGLGIFGLGYDTNGDGMFSVTGAQDTTGKPTIPVFTSGISDMNTNPATVEAPASSTAASPGQAGDHYVEAWNDNGFWELFTSGTSTTYPVTWTDSANGASTTSLVNNSWYALSISDPEYDSNIPGAAVAAAVPEPGVVALFGLGAFVIIWHAKRRTYAA